MTTAVVNAIGLAALAIGACIVWTLIILRVRKGQPVLEHQPRRPVPWQGVDLAAILLAYLIVASVVIIALQRAGIVHTPQASPTAGEAAPQVPLTGEERTVLIAADAGIKLIAAAIGVAWVIFRVRATAADFGVGTSRIGKDILIGVAAFFGSALAVFLLEDLLQRFIPYSHDVVKALELNRDAKTFAITGVAAIIVAPIAEELFFRVMIQGCLEAVEAKRRWLLQRHIKAQAAAASPPALQQPAASPPSGEGADNPYRSPAGPARHFATEEELRAASGPAAWPIVVSSALFALIHLGQGPAPVPLFFFALVLGYVYQRTHRIWPSMIAHAMLNATSMLVLWFSAKPA